MDTQNSASDLIGQREIRIEKVKQLKELGFNPYPAKSGKNIPNNEVLDDYEELKDSEVTVAGRITSWRQHGEIQFMDIQDRTGNVQLYIHNSELNESNPAEGIIGLEHMELLDLGDYIEATGIVTETNRGVESVKPESIKLLTKALRPMPNKWGKLEDKEQRYRRRYLDMTMDQSVMRMFERRAKFWQHTRDFLNERGFFEVNIPVLEHTTGGADARPFVTKYDILDEEFYLRISHELPLKRLIGGGFEKVYDLGVRFRNEGFSDEHLPEHIAMEWYWAYADWRDGMKLTEEMFKYILEKTFGTLKFTFEEFGEVDLSGDWPEKDYTTLLNETYDIDIFEQPLEELAEILKEHNPGAEIVMNRSRIVDGLWKVIRKKSAGPYFLTGVPLFMSPLAKASEENPKVTERFHPIILGSEMANAFTELNDPQEQLDRFVEQKELRESGDDEAHMMDIDFVEMLEYGMAPTVGYGMSERVFWSFEGVTAKEGVPFPPMKRHFDETTKQIYSDVYNFKK